MTNSLWDGLRKKTYSDIRNESAFSDLKGY